ncbi:SulP family sulfate permease [Streptosporangium becharense]|uniref:SulP family sulfate permease n=1 Tax=Streptosporangium becharense TaxID=1816182 RepID=A0A7W9MK19_9ACTN|nr:SulP family inorganic anion transporter [Streptosporangium becharense]MBB2910306.1 SulP family sulfate permease [Streptosporangium becharense]MBB5823049.1 SulP family sulfate permease [Streptosporangium becharense]
MSATTIPRRLPRLLPARSDWGPARRDPGRDLVAGLVVAVVALPLALAFGVSSGLGAQAGLVTAIVAGALAAIFGGSNLQVSGPTGAMTVVLVPIVHRHGVGGVLTVGLLAGLILIALAAVRAGRLAGYLPTPVVEGFTAGIAVVIALQQIPAALGVEGTPGEKVWQTAADAFGRYVADPRPVPLIMTLAVTALILVGARVRPAIPFSLVAVVGATAVAAVAPLDVATIGAIPAGLPAPSLAFADPATLTALLPPALAVAALAALESLLCATVADAMSVGERHDPDRELFGQGIANLVVPLFGGVPATAAIARTAVNVRAGARSRLAALSHAVILAVIVFTAGGLVGRIPLAALAGVLIATTVRMVEVGSLRAIARSTRSDGLVLLLTFTVTVVFDLVTAVAVGVGVAVVLALRAVARTAQLEQVPLETGDHDAEERRLLAEHIVAYRFDGPLFFAAAHRFLLELSEVADVRVVILRMSRVSTLDATGAQVLGDAITRLERRGIVVLLSGVRPRHDQVLVTLGVAGHLRRDGLIFPDTPAAIAHARRLLTASAA